MVIQTRSMVRSVIGQSAHHNTGHTMGVSHSKLKTKSSRSKSVITKVARSVTFGLDKSTVVTGPEPIRLRRYYFKHASISRMYPTAGRVDRVKFTYKGLSESDKVRVKNIVEDEDTTKKLGEYNGIDITVGDLQQLRNGQVSNSIMDSYLAAYAEKINNPNIHCMDLQFFTNIITRQHGNIQHLQVLEKSLVVIPIERNNHWVLVVMDFERSRFEYYDPLGGRTNHYVDYIKDYFATTSLKYVTDWQVIYPSVNEQKTGVDCGVFVAQWIRCRYQNIDLGVVVQERIKAYRKHMLVDILNFLNK